MIKQVKVFHYDNGKNVVGRELNTTELELLSGDRSCQESQTMLQRLSKSKRWLACDCKTPMALMYTRHQSGTYGLVNHYHSGVHDPSCRFHTQIKGAEREDSSRDFVDDSLHDLLGRENIFALFRLFPAEYTTHEDGNDDKKVTTPSKPKIDSLFRILYNCIDSGYQNHFFGEKFSKDQQSVLNQLMLARDRTDAMYVRGGMPHLMSQEERDKIDNPLKEICFVGERGKEMAESFLITEMKKRKGRSRPTAIVFLTADSYHYEPKRRSVSLVNDYDGSPSVTHLTDLVTPPKYATDMSHSFDYPVVVIAAMTFESPDSKLPVVGKVAVQPILGDGSICPVNNVYELNYLRTVNFILTHYRNTYPDFGFRLTKPLFGFKNHPHLQPSFILSIKNIHTNKIGRCYVEIVADKLKATLEKSENSLEQIKFHYKGEVQLIKSFEYPTDKEREYIKDVTIMTKKSIAAILTTI
ncbi:hypothetical protein A1QO_00815 [Vibrio genomosp. F10 str. ZF-129]|uniref:DUF1173 domain-containing protein n=1 Tax=Vibrio genomosp. F10 str. ZF-129 TaxID=1187848 RepID=A0A1E5BGD4_9VIBR|nr:hypothetical protein [Vibrio genomosp. F10]OEE35334.1 hypothetical protein A1QO_00815 [Vibrio genomosp. F10 str. ZF-129]